MVSLKVTVLSTLPILSGLFLQKNLWDRLLCLFYQLRKWGDASLRKKAQCCIAHEQGAGIGTSLSESKPRLCCLPF